MPSKRLRRPGSPWRLLVHDYTGEQPDGTSYDVSHHIANTRPPKYEPSQWRQDHIFEGSEFDELVVGKWATVHIEQMDTSLWWMNIGNVTINIRVDRDGRPKRVDVYGPGDWAGHLPGVEYNLTWSGVCDDCGEVRCICAGEDEADDSPPIEDVPTGGLL